MHHQRRGLCTLLLEVSCRRFSFLDSDMLGRAHQLLHLEILQCERVGVGFAYGVQGKVLPRLYSDDCRRTK